MIIYSKAKYIPFDVGLSLSETGVNPEFLQRGKGVRIQRGLK